MANNENFDEMPHDSRAESAILGSIFLEPSSFYTANQLLTPQSFYSKKHQLIYQAMVTVHDRGESVDDVTVSQELDRQKLLGDGVDVDDIYNLANDLPTYTDIEHYIGIVKQLEQRRQLIRVSQDIAKQAFQGKLTPNDILNRTERQLMRVTEGGSHRDFDGMSDALEETLNNVYEQSKNHRLITGLPSGYGELDRMTSGLHKDELMIIAARPGMGKTAFALNIAQNVAVKHPGHAVALFSLEMGTEQLMQRILCAEGSIDASRLRSGQLLDDEQIDVTIAGRQLMASNLVIDSTPGIQMTEIRSKCLRLAMQQPLDMVVIDYLQLIESPRRDGNRQQEISEISRQLKKLAKELHVPVIALSQLSRYVEQRQDKRPMLSDLRESGAIEQDADIVAFLYREDYYKKQEKKEDDPPNHKGDTGEKQNEEETDEGDETIEIIIEKNRSGKRGTIKLIFSKNYNKFSSIFVPNDD